MGKLHVALGVFQRSGAFQICRFGGLVDDLKDPLCRRQGGLELAVDLCDLPDGPGELSGVEHEGRDAADADGAMEIQDGSEHGDQGQGQVVDGIGGGAHDAGIVVGLIVGVHQLLILHVHVLNDPFLLGIGPEGLLAGDHFLHIAV